SPAERWNSWPNSDPNAPPVMMIGPSAPNGPPVPIEIADDTGFNTATFGSILLWPMRMASIASGMPWPRIFSEPYRAIIPTPSAPTTGTTSTHPPRRSLAGDTRDVDQRPKNATLVIKPMRRSSAYATTALSAPTNVAMSARTTTRASVVKSRSTPSERVGGCMTINYIVVRCSWILGLELWTHVDGGEHAQRRRLRPTLAVPHRPPSLLPVERGAGRRGGRDPRAAPTHACDPRSSRSAGPDHRGPRRGPALAAPQHGRAGRSRCRRGTDRT